MIKKISALLLFAITISSCREKKHEWSVSISAPKEYPVVIQRGFMGKSFFGPSCINSSWGSGLEVAKKQAFDDPETFEITWLSLVERKFYKGKWLLPKNKIKNYSDKGVYGEHKNFNYNKIQIGLAPKGLVIVWLINDEETQIEIGRYQATQFILDSKDVYESSKFMFNKDFIDKELSDPKFFKPEIKENVKEYGYPLPTIYDLYREKYTWKPEVILPNSCSISYIDIKMCNGENKTQIRDSKLITEPEAIPYLFKISWKNKKGQEFITRIVFIEKKYWQNYNTYSKDDLPLNFHKNSVLLQFKEHLKKNLPAKIVIQIDNELISDFYLEQLDKKWSFTGFNYETIQVLKKSPCICK